MLKPIRWIAFLAVGVWLASLWTQPGMTGPKLLAHLEGDVAQANGQIVAALHSAGVHSSASAATGVAYTWMNTTAAGTPVTWGTCSVHYVLNVDEAPGGKAVTSQVVRALAMITGASGIHFVFDGYTHVIPTNEWATTGFKADPTLAGDTYPPVAFGWAYRNQTDLFNGPSAPADAVAMTGPDTVSGPGGEHYVSGSGVIDASYAAGLTPGFGAGLTEGELLVHELEHVVGVGEGSNPANLDYTQMIPRGAVTLGPGDVAALRTLGGACVS